MIAQEPPLAGCGRGQDRLIKLKTVEIGRKLLGNHTLGIMHLEQITHLLTPVRCPAMPHLRAEDDHIAGFAENTLRAYPLVGGVPARLIL